MFKWCSWKKDIFVFYCADQKDYIFVSYIFYLHLTLVFENCVLYHFHILRDSNFNLIFKQLFILYIQFFYCNNYQLNYLWFLHILFQTYKFVICICKPERNICSNWKIIIWLFYKICSYIVSNNIYIYKILYMYFIFY